MKLVVIDMYLMLIWIVGCVVFMFSTLPILAPNKWTDNRFKDLRSSFKKLPLLRNFKTKHKESKRDKTLDYAILAAFIFVFQVVWLIILFEISSAWFSIETQESFDNIIVILTLFCLLLMVLEVLVGSVKALIKSLYKLDELSEGKAVYQTIALIFFIIAAPIGVFAFIYNLSIPAASLFKSPVSSTEIWEYVYYSLTISYSLPSDDIVRSIQDQMNGHGWLKIIPSVQVIVQRFVDIVILGYAANIFHRILSHSIHKNK